MSNQSLVNTEKDTFDIKDSQKIALFFLGFLLYDTFNFLFSVFSNQLLRLPQIIGLGLVIYSGTFFLKTRMVTGYFKAIFSMLMLWNFITILRFDSLSVDEVRLVLFHPLHLLSYLVPLVILIQYNSAFFQSIRQYAFRASWIFGTLYIVVCLILLPVNNLTDFIIGTSLLPIVGFVSMWYEGDRKKYVFLIAILLLCLYAGVIAGRRTIILVSVLYLIGNLYLAIIKSTAAGYIKTLILSLLAILVTTWIFININYQDYKVFDSLSDRIDVDSRSEVFDYFFKDLQGMDWFVGRGIDGTYYNPINYWNLDNEESREVTYRDNIENGYLYIVLKQGFIGVILFLLIAIPACVSSLLNKNLIIKACGLYILIYLITMISYGQPAFYSNYLILWICIGISLSVLRKTNQLHYARIGK